MAVTVMALVWLLMAMAALAAYGLLTFLAGADSRAGVDGDGALGRRTHRPESWW
jgi:hypothetical protein